MIKFTGPIFILCGGSPLLPDPPWPVTAQKTNKGKAETKDSLFSFT